MARSASHLSNIQCCGPHSTMGMIMMTTLEEQGMALPVAPPPTDKIIDVLNDQLVSTRQGRIQKFLVNWQNCQNSDATWITITDFQCLNSDLCEYYQAINSTKLSSSKQERVYEVRTRAKKSIRPSNWPKGQPSSLGLVRRPNWLRATMGISFYPNSISIPCFIKELFLILLLD